MKQESDIHLTARSNAGFTLVEVLVSIVMLMGVIIATSSLISNGMIGTRMGVWDNAARTAATAEMERLKARPWSEIAAMPLYPSFAKNFCTAPDGTALPGTDPDTWTLADPINSPCNAGLLPNTQMQGRVYVQLYDANGDGVPDNTIRKITTSVSVYSTSNPLANLLQPLFDTVAFAGGGGGGGGGSVRSIWRMTTLVSQDGLSR